MCLIGVWRDKGTTSCVGEGAWALGCRGGVGADEEREASGDVWGRKRGHGYEGDDKKMKDKKR